jgi:tRNA1Val (adenine37-N6)-methyltransferase
MTTFHCQQFSLQQQHSAMKICTDSLLFGAMAKVKAADKVLDIGTGTGLLALMLAQMGCQQITAVEMDQPAYREASLNFSRSPWSPHLVAIHQDIQTYATGSTCRYDLIISNPPFFHQHAKSQNPERSMARHGETLSLAELFASVEKLLLPQGSFYILLPVHRVAEAIALARSKAFFLNREIAIRSFSHKPTKVSALSFSMEKSDHEAELLTVYDAPNSYSTASRAYLQPFLLRFAQV